MAVYMKIATMIIVALTRTARNVKAVYHDNRLPAADRCDRRKDR